MIHCAQRKSGGHKGGQDEKSFHAFVFVRISNSLPRRVVTQPRMSLRNLSFDLVLQAHAGRGIDATDLGSTLVGDFHLSLVGGSGRDGGNGEAKVSSEVSSDKGAVAQHGAQVVRDAIDLNGSQVELDGHLASGHLLGDGSLDGNIEVLSLLWWVGGEVQLTDGQ